MVSPRQFPVSAVPAAAQHCGMPVLFSILGALIVGIYVVILQFTMPTE
jgi:hypothetical protein